MEVFAMSVRGFREQKRWGTRTFGESTQTDSESEEDGVTGGRGGVTQGVNWEFFESF